MSKVHEYLIYIILFHCPGEKEQKLVSKHLGKCEDELALVGILYDGLKFNNWPWNKTND